MTRFRSVAGFVLAAGLTAATAAAQDIEVRGGVATIAVSYDDADLAGAASAAALDLRLRNAARRVCRATRSLSLLEPFEQRECYLETLDDARAQVRLAGRPRQAAAAAGRTIVVAAR